MKKCLIILLCAILALSACASALADTANAILGYDDAHPNGIAFRTCYTDGETLYMIAYDGLYTCKVGDDALTRYEFPTEDEDHPADEYSVSCLVFAGSEGLCGVKLFTSTEDDYDFEEAVFGDVTLEDGQVLFEDRKTINWDDMTNFYDGFASAATVWDIVCMDDVAYMVFYGSSSARQLAALDLDRGRLELIEDIPTANMITAYKDGKLLVESIEAGSGDSQVTFMTYDPEEEEVETVGSGTVEGDKGIQAIAYDAETDVLYGVYNGQICPVNIETCELGEPVNNLPIAISEFGSSGVILPGSIYAYAENGLALRDLSVEHQPTSTLTIQDSVWASSTRKAYMDFMRTHEDVGAAMLEELWQTGSLVDDMMKQNDAIDIYVMSCGSSTFDAVHSRGYMLELDDCPNVQALAEEMYPVFREAMSYNGSMVAIPVRTSGGDIGVNLKALEKLGYTEDDIPTSWEGLLNFMDELAENWDEDAGVNLAAEFASDTDAKDLIMLSMLIAYQHYVMHSEEPMLYNSDTLRGLIEHLNNIDFEALGCKHPEDENEFLWPDENNISLFSFFGRNACLGSWYQDMQPVVLSIEEGGEALMFIDCAAAFVNPFTKNPQAALDFMDQLAQDLEPDVRYNLVPTLSEPVRDAGVEQRIAEAEDKIAKLEAKLENAEDEEVQKIEDDIDTAKQELEDLEKRVWSISEDQIAWYRAHEDQIRMGGVDWLLSSDGGEAYELVYQYLQGQIDAEEMLSGIDQKIQMRMKEGN